MMNNKFDFLIVIDWLVTPLMEIGAEIALEKASQDKQIFILIIDDYLKSEGFNKRLPNILSSYDIPKKLERIILSSNFKNIKVFRKKIYKNIELNSWPNQILAAYKDIQKNEHEPINKKLKNIHLNNINVGEGILSSIISITKNKYPIYFNDKKIIRVIFDLFVRRYKVYEDFFKEEFKIENLVIFNGRFASSKAIKSGISKHKEAVNILFYERSSTLERYRLKPYSPHDREKVVGEINKIWNECTNQNEAAKIAKTFFKTKVSGKGTDWFPFSKGIQEVENNKISEILNDYIKDDKNKIISYFTSSEDEFESLGDLWLDQRFQLSQKNIIKELSSIAIKKNILLVIRVHPNVNNASQESKSNWTNIFKELPNKNILIIKETNNISSYSIVNNSNIVVVYGSTIGIEALFLEKPVIVAGSSFYFGTKAKIQPAFKLGDLEKEIDFLLKNSIVSKENRRILKESSYPYGYWMYTNGFKYKYFSPVTPIRGFLLNCDLQKIHRILSFFKKILKGLILSK